MGGRRCRSWKVVALIGNTFSFFLENNVHHLVHLHIWVTILVIYFEGRRSCKRCISLDFNFSFAFWLLIKYQISSVDSIFHPSLTFKRQEILTQACQPKGFFAQKAVEPTFSSALREGICKRPALILTIIFETRLANVPKWSESRVWRK